MSDMVTPILIAGAKAGAISGSMTALSTMVLNDPDYLISLIVGLVAFIVAILNELKDMRGNSHTLLDYISRTVQTFVLSIGSVGVIMFVGSDLFEHFLHVDVRKGVIIFGALIIGIFHKKIFVTIGTKATKHDFNKRKGRDYPTYYDDDESGRY